nr:glycosyltransferase family 2 protein [Rhizobium sp. TCK]
MSARLIIVIVNYRTGALAVDCLTSLFAGTLPSETYVVVADAASGDDSVPTLEKAISQNSWAEAVLMLPLQDNRGFSASNNCALEAAIGRFGRPRYVLFLNPDTLVRPGALQALLDFLNIHPRAGIVGAHLEDPDGTPQACAFRFPTVLGELESEARIGLLSRLLSMWRIAPKLPDLPARVDWVSGAALLAKMELLEDTGGFDPDYFLYFEEVDLCLRAARNGWECWHVPDSHIVHLVGQSTGVTRKMLPSRRPPYWFRSRQRFFVKHYGRGYMALSDLAWAAGQTLWHLRLVLTRRGQTVDPPHLFKDFLRHSVTFHFRPARSRASLPLSIDAGWARWAVIKRSSK